MFLSKNVKQNSYSPKYTHTSSYPHISVGRDSVLPLKPKRRAYVAQEAKVIIGRQLCCQKGYAFHNLVVRHPPILWQSGGVLSCALIIGAAIARKATEAAKRNTKATEARKRNKCSS